MAVRASKDAPGTFVAGGAEALRVGVDDGAGGALAAAEAASRAAAVEAEVEASCDMVAETATAVAAAEATTEAGDMVVAAATTFDGLALIPNCYGLP